MEQLQKQPPQPEQSTPLTVEQLKDHLAELSDGKFLVHRSDGTIESGWSIAGAGIGPEGNLAVALMKQETNEVKQGVDAQTLLDWQPKTPQLEAPLHFTPPAAETDALEQARIYSQTFANEVNATQAYQSRAEQSETAADSQETQIDQSQRTARTMGLKAIEARLGPLPDQTDR